MMSHFDALVIGGLENGIRPPPTNFKIRHDSQTRSIEPQLLSLERGCHNQCEIADFC